jgi:hypothetical protein
MSEGVGGGVLETTSHPPIDRWFDEIQKHDNTWGWIATEPTVILKDNNYISDYLKNQVAKVLAKYPNKGKRAGMSFQLDPTAQLTSIEHLANASLDIFKYPVQI